MARLFLHVGFPKSGSSAIQAFLALNHDRLPGLGYQYPEPPRLRAFATSSGNGPCFCRGRAEHDPDGQRRLVAGVDPALDVVVSSEMFYMEGAETIRDVRDAFPDRDVTVVAYLRRQDHWAESRINQRIKASAKTDNAVPGPLDAIAALEPIASVFGREAIVVRPYEPGQWVGGSLYADFAAILGLEFPGSLVIPDGLPNPSMPRHLLELKRVLNGLPLSALELGSRLPTRLQELAAAGTPGVRPFDYPILSPAERLEILRAHQASNARVAREYLGREDGVLFEEPPPSPDEPWEPYPGVPIETVIQTLGYLYATMAQENEQRLATITSSPAWRLADRVGAALLRLRRRAASP